MTKRVLITGAAGFVGSEIASQFRRAGYDVSALDDLSSGRRENLPAGVALIKADVRRDEAVRRAFEAVRPTIVCHQAALSSVPASIEDPAKDASVNVIGWINVLENCVRSGVERVVFASSGGALYGNVRAPAAETRRVNPHSPYGVGKWAGEAYLEYYSNHRGLQGVALRYSNVYGPRQTLEGEAGVVARFSQLMAERRPVVIHGTGRQVRDFVYVSDVASANLLAVRRKLSASFLTLNVATGIGTTILELEEKMRRIATGSGTQNGNRREPPPPRFGPARAGDIPSSILAPRRASQLLGWKPRVGINQGLEATFRWFDRAHQRRPRPSRTPPAVQPHANASGRQSA